MDMGVVIDTKIETSGLNPPVYENSSNEEEGVIEVPYENLLQKNLVPSDEEEDQ